MANLAGDHRDLASVVGVVGDQIADKSSDIRTKAFDTAIGFEGAADDDAESMAAGFQRVQGLFRSDSRAI